MDVYLCEKPSQAKDLAAVLGVNQRGKGHLHDGGRRVVTWAFGHLLEEAPPDAYGEQYKRWALETLPIIPDTWIKTVRQDAKDQYHTVIQLLNDASEVYIATDFDREGEAIARDLINRSKFKGPMKRVRLQALDPTNIRKALDSAVPAEETLPLYHAAIARSRADWLVGMNLTRLFTLIGRKLGADSAIQVGRVQTPMISLVCSRDADIKNFKPVPFYTLEAEVAVQNGVFKAEWVPPEDMSDEQGRCLNKTFISQVKQQVHGQQATISTAEVKDGTEGAPLPLNLTALQQYASKRWGYTADETLSTAQKLYETYKVTSYPRSDSRYIPEAQHAEAPAIMQALMRSDQAFTSMVAGANTATTSRAFDDSKVTAHHAIIPVNNTVDIASFTLMEQRIYDAIRRHYVAQFYTPHTFQKTNIQVTCCGHQFKTAGRVPKIEGWRIVFAGMMESERDAAKDNASSTDNEPEKELPSVQLNEAATMRNTHVASKSTRPPPHFTDDTLLGAMENISRFVDEPKYKAILKESAGLGTSATRADSIKGAIAKGYLKRQKRNLIATDKAFAMTSIVPPIVRSPGFTAQWEQQLEVISSGNAPMDGFNQHIENFVSTIVQQITSNIETLTAADSALAKQFKKLQGPSYPCFDCGSPLHRRRKGKEGFFWKCSSTTCGATFSDKRNMPQKRQQRIEGAPCGECGSTMVLREYRSPKTGKKEQFWGCSSYPKCKGRAPYTNTGKAAS